MSISARFSSLCVLAVLVSAAAQSQTAPQLLPYTAKLIAGGASSNPAKGGICPTSGYTALDASGDGCLATEILLGTGASTPGPRDAVADAAGNVFFSDYANALVRRVDVLTGIVTIVAGGGTTSAGTATTGTLGSAVRLSHPAALTFNPATGDLYFSDPGNGQVFKIAATGGIIGGSVGSVAITNGGSGYTTPPIVTFSAPASGITATGTATISGGTVTGVTITNSGSGYSSTPTVTFGSPLGGSTATGFVGVTGPITLVAGNTGGTYGYAASNAASTISEAAGNSYLRAVYGLAFDSKGDLFMADEYYYAIIVLNTSSATNTVNNTTIPPGQIVKVVGSVSAPTSNTSTTYCTNGTASSSGCANGIYNSSSYFATGVQANGDEVRGVYSVGVDPNGNLYSPDEYYNATFKVNPAGVLTNFAGTPNSAAKVITRAPAGSFSMGSSFGIASDSNSNVYISDASAGVIWRIDHAGLSEYVVAGGVGDNGGPTAVCSAPAATDTLGDGCPGTQAIIGSSGTGNFASTTLPGPGIYGISVDSYSDLFFADTEKNDVREIASGTQFGPVGANQPTQNVEIHFANGDVPASANPYSITAGGSNFSLGTAKCTTNSDGSTDCILPITATPTVLGPFTGTLQVTAQIGGTSTFPLSGTYIQSPITRTGLSYVAGVACTGTTTYSTTTPITLTATVTANGPAPPTMVADTITFYANNGTTNTAIGTVQVTNIGTSTSPVYGATLNYTFSTAGTYTLTAVYSGDTYFKTSTGKSAATITSSTPSFTITPVAYMQSTIAQGQTALYSFNVNQVVYSGTVTFAVTGLPANSSYSLSPTNINGAGCSTNSIVALSIFTNPVPPPGVASIGGTGSGAWLLLGSVTGIALALLIGLRGRRLSKRFAHIGMILALLLAASGLVACNSYTVSAAPPTPVGTYTLTVTATGSAGGTSTITLPLTVN